MDSLGVGVIGYGFIGKVHCHAHLSIPLFYSPPPARARLVGVASATEATGKAAMEQAGFRFATTDYRQIIDSEEVQIVHICTPNDLHTEQALAAIHAGKHVYCDKPLAAGLGDAQRSYQASLGAAGVCQMTFNYRFVPALLRARELAQQGFLGDLYAFRVAYLHAGYVDPSRPYSWRVDRARSGGGAVADLGSHAIDLLRFLVGPGTAVGRAGEVASITGRLQTVIPQRRDRETGAMRAVEVDDIAVAQCELQGGALGTLEASRVSTGTQDELRLELHGSGGGLRFNLMDPNWLEAYDARPAEAAYGGDRGYRRIEAATRYGPPYSLGATKNTVGWMSFHIHSLFNFLGNVSAKLDGGQTSPLSPTFADGLAVQRVISAWIESASVGRSVSIDWP